MKLTKYMEKLKQQIEKNDLGVMVCGNLNWLCNIENRLIESNKVFAFFSL